MRASASDTSKLNLCWVRRVTSPRRRGCNSSPGTCRGLIGRVPSGMTAATGWGQRNRVLITARGALCHNRLGCPSWGPEKHGKMLLMKASRRVPTNDPGGFIARIRQASSKPPFGAARSTGLHQRHDALRQNSHLKGVKGKKTDQDFWSPPVAFVRTHRLDPRHHVCARSDRLHALDMWPGEGGAIDRNAREALFATMDGTGEVSTTRACFERGGGGGYSCKSVGVDALVPVAARIARLFGLPRTSHPPVALFGFIEIEIYKRFGIVVLRHCKRT